MTIDEIMPGFRGRCPFKQYIPSKPTKYGIKTYALVNSRMVYTNNLKIYARKQSEGPFSVSNKLSDVVKQMTEPFGKGRHITADNWFTGIELVNELRKKKKRLSHVGMLRKNKRQIPA